MTKKTKKRTRTVIPIDFKPELKEELEELAKAQGLGTSTYIRRIIYMHVNNQKRLVRRSASKASGT